ncbi:hypothetical protein P8605_25925 [Streptomyces sp. T-3]|nr:hypothetical protein [Streptomyces sp. T-3]
MIQKKPTRTASIGATVCLALALSAGTTLASPLAAARPGGAPDPASPVAEHFTLLTEVSTALAPVGDVTSTILRGERDKSKLHGKKSKVDARLDGLLARGPAAGVPGRDRSARVKSIKANIAALIDSGAGAQEDKAERVAVDLNTDVSQFVFDTSVSMGLDAPQALALAASDPTEPPERLPKGKAKKRVAENFALVTNVSDALAPVGALATTVLGGETDPAKLDALKTQADEELENLLAFAPGGSPASRSAGPNTKATVRAVKAGLARLYDAATKQGSEPAAAATDLNADTRLLLFQTSVHMGLKATLPVPAGSVT